MNDEKQAEPEEERCPHCNGTGVETYNPAPFGFNPGNRMYQRTCIYCNGKGVRKKR